MAGPSELVEQVRDAVGVLGGVLDAPAAWLLLRGLKTLALRVARHNENGLAGDPIADLGQALGATRSPAT